MLKQGLLSILLCAVVIFSINACSSLYPVTPVPETPTALKAAALGMAGGAVVASFSTGASIPLSIAIGGIIGGAAGMALAEREGLLNDLDRDDVQIIRIGEEVMLVLPSDVYFYPNSSHLNPEFYGALRNVAEFLREFETESIKVAGFTDVVGDKTRNLALSRQQAQNIAHYLWRQGLDARMMYTIGYGERYPIANNESVEGRSANRRVQITFRYIPSDSGFR